MDFHAWLQQRPGPLPDADRLIQLIWQAGRLGIPQGQLRAAVELPRETFDELLAALVSARTVAVVEKDGKRWYVGR
jgi:hypothetical protein